MNLDSYFSGANLLAGLLFGSIGFVAFVYGKKQGRWSTMGIGGLLTLYPFVVTNTVATWIVGAALTAALFVFKD